MNRYDYVCLGPVPADEDCAQVGDADYYERAPLECKRFIELIRETVGPEPKGAELAVKQFAHDFSPYGYYEVVCYWDNDYPKSEDYAFKCETDAPFTWEGEQNV